MLFFYVPDEDVENKTGHYALLRAVDGGFTSSVKLLLNLGKVELDLRDSDCRRLLSQVASKGYESIVKMLLYIRMVEVDSKDSYSRTALSYAVFDRIWFNCKATTRYRESQNRFEG